MPVAEGSALGIAFSSRGESKMKPLKMYESTILTDISSHAAHLVVLPSASVMNSEAIALDDLLAELGMRKIAAVRAANLAQTLAILLSPAAEGDKVESALVLAASAQVEAEYARSDLQFAEIVAFDPIVPIEQSMLSAGILANLVKASGVTIGAFAGFVAVGPSPLLFVTIPAGMIICGAAKPLAEALESGLREKLQDYLKGKRKKKRGTPPQAKAAESD
jgi:hypothetical protein